MLGCQGGPAGEGRQRPPFPARVRCPYAGLVTRVLLRGGGGGGALLRPGHRRPPGHPQDAGTCPTCGLVSMSPFRSAAPLPRRTPHPPPGRPRPPGPPGPSPPHAGLPRQHTSDPGSISRARRIRPPTRRGQPRMGPLRRLPSSGDGCWVHIVISFVLLCDSGTPYRLPQHVTPAGCVAQHLPRLPPFSRRLSRPWRRSSPPAPPALSG